MIKATGPWYGCGLDDLVQLEMIGTVPEIPAGERLTWSSAGKQRFIYRNIPEVDAEEIIEDPESFEFPKTEIIAYHAIAGFDVSPYGIQFHRPEPTAFCVIEGAQHQGIEQFAQIAHGFEVFGLSQYEPLPIAWPAFNQESPLTLRLHNPLERPLLSFHLSLHVTAPKDFAEKWIDEEQGKA